VVSTRKAAATFSLAAAGCSNGTTPLPRAVRHAVGELVDQLGISQPGASKHLRVLREAGLVSVRRDAQRRWYELRPAPLAEIDEWLAPYRRLWSDRLDALERHLDERKDEQ